MKHIRGDTNQMMAALYLQVSIVSQALIFVTRSRSWSYVERPGSLLLCAFCIAQLVRMMVPFIPFMKLFSMQHFDMLEEANRLWCSQVATLIAVYADWSFAHIKGMGWGWAGVIWLYSVIFYIPLDFIKFAIRYILSGKAWTNMIENKV